MWGKKESALLSEFASDVIGTVVTLVFFFCFTYVGTVSVLISLSRNTASNIKGDRRRDE